ncbi:MAG: hypothetical protein IBX41_07365 [Methanophagales archaeon]|nr:hypothetical protein [Methanophagales archaeon]
MRRKILATGILLFILVSFIIWTALPWIEYSNAYDSGMEYADKGTNLIGRASYEYHFNFNSDEAARLSLYASENFSLARSKFEEAAEIAKNNPFRVHLVESIYNKFPMKERARAEEMANRSLKCSELALAAHEELKYIKEGKYTSEEEKYIRKEISQLMGTIPLGSPSRVRVISGEVEKMIIFHLFPLVSLGEWISGITLLGFLIGYFMKRYASIFAFLIGFVISIYYVAIHLYHYMNIPKGNYLFLLALFFLICIWAGFGLGFIGYGTSVLGRRIRKGEKPFLNKREFVGIGIISIFTIWLILVELVLIPYYPPRLYPQIYTICGIHLMMIIFPLTAFLYGVWSKERHGIMSFMIAYFPSFVLGCSWLEGSWLCFPIGMIFGLAGLAGWLVSKYRSVKSV